MGDFDSDDSSEFDEFEIWGMFTPPPKEEAQKQRMAYKRQRQTTLADLERDRDRVRKQLEISEFKLEAGRGLVDRLKRVADEDKIPIQGADAVMQLVEVLGADPAHILAGIYQPCDKAGNGLAPYWWSIKLLEVLEEFARTLKSRYTENMCSELKDQIESQIQARIRSDPESGWTLTADDIERVLAAHNDFVRDETLQKREKEQTTPTTEKDKSMIKKDNMKDERRIDTKPWPLGGKAGMRYRLPPPPIPKMRKRDVPKEWKTFRVEIQGVSRVENLLAHRSRGLERIVRPTGTSRGKMRSCRKGRPLVS